MALPLTYPYSGDRICGFRKSAQKGIVPIGQGYKDISPPIKEMMKLTLEKRLAHGSHPVLRWCMDNVSMRQEPAGNIKMDKENSTKKIDVAVAPVMVLDQAIRRVKSA